MRVVFNHPEEFLTEIAAEAEHVLGGVVRIRIDREPEQPEEITFRVGVWLTAVIVNESGPYLVEFGGVVGSDDGRTPEGGTQAAAAIRERTEQVCRTMRLQLRDGKIEAA